ncbi:MAG: hypothetical protein JW781_07765 [Deltaproteobacteria bacterium]|nr:hypothetical protein [Candidatus Anaeroferrophillacea bacterium]
MVGATALLLNVPLGYLRAGVDRYTVAWFVYIHLSIPLIIWLRRSLLLDWRFVPLFILAAAAGQYLGGRLRRHEAP